jgi:glutathione S-transferase
VLEDAGLTLTESRLISEYLEDAYPATPLTPSTAAGRYRMRQWTRYVDEVVTEAIKLPSFARNIAPTLQALPRDEVLAQVSRIPNPHIRWRWHRAATSGISAEDMAPSVRQLVEMVSRLDDGLRDGPWLAGDHISLADLDIAPFVQRLGVIDLFDHVQARPRVHDWFERLRARPAYARAMPPLQAPASGVSRPT